MEFYYAYGVRNLQGVRYGYAGLNPKIGLSPIELTPRSVSDIHENGVFTHIPIPLAVSDKKQVDPLGLLWSSVLATTGQPRKWGV
jgi:hypothetical protein